MHQAVKRVADTSAISTPTDGPLEADLLRSGTGREDESINILFKQ
jgi:hypothetical protein